MNNSEQITDEYVERSSLKSELLSIVQQYSKIIDMIESTTIVDEESKR